MLSLGRYLDSNIEEGRALNSWLSGYGLDVVIESKSVLRS